MSDEQNNKSDQTSEWSMPEPVFRSSEGRAPGKHQIEDLQAEIPTEPGFTDPQEDIPTEPGVRENDQETDSDTAPAGDVLQAQAAKSGGCATTLLSIVGVAGLMLLILAVTAIYFLFYYRPASTGNF